MIGTRRAACVGVAALVLAATVGVGRALPAEAKHCKFTTANSVRRVDTTAKLVALTFDDGPTSGMTPKVLAALAARDVKATFFVVGQALRSRGAVARAIVDQGHEIANHSYTHAFGVPTKIIDELDRTSQAIVDATGVRPTLFRAPGGCLNDKLDAAVVARGMIPIQWTTHSGDSTWPRPSKTKMCRTVVRNAKPGAIVVFHDSGPLSGRGNHKSTLDALPCIIDGLRAQGYEPVTVSELLAAATPT